VDELLARANALEGRSVTALAQSLGFDTSGLGVRTKGKVGELVERFLGAHGGSSAVHDFPDLGVELKTIPLDEKGTPKESTFVCAISLTNADEAEWETSWVRSKLSRVLFLPVVDSSQNLPERHFGRPLFWIPTETQDAYLRMDFDDLMGTIAIGGIERITAHMGRILQIRPKAAHGGIRTTAYGEDGEVLSTVPRGFYMRARFTKLLLQDPAVDPTALAKGVTSSSGIK
jgi:DNA mismatch repair protein MutH